MITFVCLKVNFSKRSILRQAYTPNTPIVRSNKDGHNFRVFLSAENKLRLGIFKSGKNLNCPKPGMSNSSHVKPSLLVTMSIFGSSAQDERFSLNPIEGLINP